MLSSSTVVSNFDKLPENLGARWSAFEECIECPYCKDRNGHCGIMEDDHHAFCVKCDTHFYIKGARVSYVDNDNKPKTGIVRKHFWEVEKKTIPAAAANSSYSKMRNFVVTYISNSIDKTKQYLFSRGYSVPFVDYLIKEGYYYLERFPEEEKLALMKGYKGLPMFQEIRYNNSKDHIMKYVPYKGLKAIAMPMMYDGKVIGLNLRNINPKLDRARYFAFKTVNTGKEGGAVDKNQKFEPRFTFLNHGLPADVKNSNYAPIYITEGDFKARAIHFNWKHRVLAGLSVKDLMNDHVKSIIAENRQRTFIIVPDRDFRTLRSVAKGYFQLISWLDSLCIDVKFLMWDHSNKTVLDSLNGIDDALETNGVSFQLKDKRQFVTLMDARARADVLGYNLKSGYTITQPQLDNADFISKENYSLVPEVDHWYDPEKDGPQMIADLWAKYPGRPIINIAGTGFGKSHMVGELQISMFRKAYAEFRAEGGILTKPSDPRQLEFSLDYEREHKTRKKKKFNNKKNEDVFNTIPDRIVNIEQSPLNNTVTTFQDPRWKVRIGRTNTGWVYDEALGKMRPGKTGEDLDIPANCSRADQIIEHVKTRQLTTVRKDVCLKCHLKNKCMEDGYLKELEDIKHASYIRQTFNSVSLRGGDFYTFDDFTSISHFTSVSITDNDIQALRRVISQRKLWSEHSVAINHFLHIVFEKLRLGMSGSDVYEAMKRDGELDNYDIIAWRSLKEPDKAYSFNVTEDSIDISDHYIQQESMKRWFFLFLDIFLGRLGGDVFYKPGDTSVKSRAGMSADQIDMDRNGCFIIHGVDTVFRDMLENSAGVYILDATANIEYIERLFGAKPVVICAKGDPFANIKVTRVEGWNTTFKKSLRFPASQETVKQKIEYINEYVRKTGKKVGVLTYKEVLTTYGDTLDPSIIAGYWWYSDRATNVFYQEGVEVLFFIGVPIPHIGVSQAEMRASQSMSSVFCARPYKKDISGEMLYLITKESVDPIIRNYMWYKTASSYIQAAGRLRSIRQPEKQFEIFLMDEVAVPFEVSETVQATEFIENLPEKTQVREVIQINKAEIIRKVQYIDHLTKVIEDIISKTGNERMTATAEDMLSNRLLNVFYLEKFLPGGGGAVFNLKAYKEALLNYKARFLENPDTLLSANFEGTRIGDLLDMDPYSDINKGKVIDFIKEFTPYSVASDKVYSVLHRSSG